MQARIAVALLLSGVACSKPAEQPQAAAPAGPAAGTAEWKIANAMAAAPAAIGAGATIMDYPSSDTGQLTQLRAGTNGWTCLPDDSHTPGEDPICVDAQWMSWFGAWMAHQPPTTSAVGYAYMLRGGRGASMTDPFKMTPDSGQDWVVDGPHVMIIVPRAQMAWVNALPDHQAGGPYVMFKNTPYAHVMWPTQ